jgi:nucleoside-triphosphatase
MKILLTGKPGIGKSTILKKVAGNLKMLKYGIVADEIRNNVGRRVGFKAVAFDGRNSIFAHKSAFKTEFAVGEYFVDVKVINDFVVPELKRGMDKNNSVVLIDEIGRMQSLSAEFLKTIRELFSSRSNLLATIVLDDEPWSLEFKKYPGAILIEVNEKNREYLADILNIVFSSLEVYNRLPLCQQESVDKRFRNFIAENKFIQAKKLFNNAIVYASEGRVEKIGENSELIEYLIAGKINKHKTVFNKTASEYNCDCDLFNGKNEFKGNAGECSHVMAVKILNT